jgi:solute carrier family 31 (copper transporter), member 1
MLVRDFSGNTMSYLADFTAGFIASSWHVRSSGQFAGSCIGVILLVMSLEFLRRASREYDRYITLQAQSKQQQIESTNPSPGASTRKDIALVAVGIVPRAGKFRPNLFQQAIRALLHMMQFAVAYFIMLLAMYYNGYIIISIIIGAFLGSFVLSWEPITLG